MNEYRKQYNIFTKKAEAAKITMAEKEKELDALYEKATTIKEKVEARKANADVETSISIEYGAANAAYNRFQLCGRIARNMELRQAANAIFAALVSDPARASIPAHYKKFENFLESITPEGFRAYADKSFCYSLDIVVNFKDSFTYSEAVRICFDAENGAIKTDNMEKRGPLDVIPAGDILKTVKSAEKAHAEVVKAIEAANKKARETYDSLPKIDLIKTRFPYSVDLPYEKREFYR